MRMRKVQSVGSAAILCLHNAPAVEVMHVSFVPCLISPTSHYSASHHSASHLSRVSSVPCLTYSAACLFNVSHIVMGWEVHDSEQADRFACRRVAKRQVAKKLMESGRRLRIALIRSFSPVSRSSIHHPREIIYCFPLCFSFSASSLFSSCFG